MPNRSSALRRTAGLATAALFVSAFFGQAAGEQATERTFPLVYTQSTQDFQEIATTVRTIALLREMPVDAERKSLTVRGEADRIALAQWLISELDKPAGDQPGKRVEMREYRMPGSNGDLVRVVYLGFVQTSRDLQEIATVLRTNADIRLLYICNARKALTLRGSADEVELAQWMIDGLGKPAGAQNHAVREYRPAGRALEVAQVSCLRYAETPYDIQEFNTLLRTVAHVRHLFTYDSKKALVMRGSPEEMAASRWLVDELDKDGAQRGVSPRASEYRPGGDGEVVRVIYFGKSATAQDLQQFAAIVRQKTPIRKMFTYSASKALILRDTADQVALAESLVQAPAKP